MNIFILLSQAYRKFVYVDRFMAAAKDPGSSQEQKLMSIVHKNRSTSFGKDHSFSSIRNVKDFQEKVGINDHASLKGYLERAMKGEKNVLTSQEVLMFGITSGTTGNPKYIPVTKDFINEYRASWHIWNYFAIRDHPHIIDGKILTFVSPATRGRLPSGIPYGSISGLLQQIQPRFVKKRYSIPQEVFRIQDYDSRYYCISRLMLDDDASLIVTPNPGMLLMLCKKINENRRDIIEDIRNGELKQGLDLEPDIRELIERRLSPNPEKAAYLEKLLKKKRKLYPSDVWPALALVGCWKEGNMPLYIKQLPKHFGRVSIRDIGFMATEGRVTIPIDDKGSAGLLSLVSHFYEFIPEEEKHKRHPKVLTADKLEKDKRYYVLITASNGLYRYDLNDIVAVTGFYDKCPVLEFLHKGEHITSVAGEKLSEWQAMTAVRQAAASLKVPIDSFTACIHLSKPPTYAFYVEFHRRISEDRKKKFIAKIDEKLKELNIEYEAKRDSGRLQAPLLRHVKSGSYHERHRHLVSKGAHDAQVKHPCLVSDVNFERDFRKHLKIIGEVSA